VKANITMVTSGKGGAGKSTSAACLSAALAGLGKKVLLIELDMGLRGLDILLQVQNKVIYDIMDLFAGRCDTEQAVIPVEFIPGLFLLSASVNPETSFSNEDFSRLCQSFSLGYDHILIDTPAGLGKGFLSAAEAADAALLVVTPDPVCVRDAAFVSVMLEKAGMAKQRLLINRVSSDFAKNKVVPDLDSVIDLVGVQLIGVIPESRHIYGLCLRGGLLPSDSSAAKAFRATALRLCGQEADLVI